MFRVPPSLNGSATAAGSSLCLYQLLFAGGGFPPEVCLGEETRIQV